MLHLRYISRIQYFFIHSILTRPSEEGVTDQGGMSVNIGLRPTKVKNRKFSKKFTNFYFDPIIIFEVRGVICFAALGPGFTGPRPCVTKKSL